MKVRMPRRLPTLSLTAALVMPLAALAQDAPSMGGGMMGGQDHTMGEQGHTMGGGMMGGQDHMMGGQDHTMGGGMMGGQDHMMGGQDHTMGGQDHTMGGQDHTMGGQDNTMGGQDHMMGGGMMGGQDQMAHMRSMMQMRLARAGERIAALKDELRITDDQLTAWNKFADALLSAAKSTQEAMESIQREIQQRIASAPDKSAKDYPDFSAVKKTAGADGRGAEKGLPSRLAHHEKMLKRHLADLEAIKEALDPLYASFSDEQKKIADGLRIGPMGAM